MEPAIVPEWQVPLSLISLIRSVPCAGSQLSLRMNCWYLLTFVGATRRVRFIDRYPTEHRKTRLQP